MAEAGNSILVVEDDPSIRRLVNMVLKREGYTVECASDGLEAVDKLGHTDYDAIVLDLMMPNLDGFTFMSNLADNDPERMRKIIITSAASPAVIRDRMRGAPFAVLPKPFDIASLLEHVRGCIESQRAS